MPCKPAARKCSDVGSQVLFRFAYATPQNLPSEPFPTSSASVIHPKHSVSVTSIKDHELLHVAVAGTEKKLEMDATLKGGSVE
jgi:hypothetical protein